jgi:hypothetical protein
VGLGVGDRGRHEIREFRDPRLGIGRQRNQAQSTSSGRWWAAKQRHQASVNRRWRGARVSPPKSTTCLFARTRIRLLAQATNLERIPMSTRILALVGSLRAGSYNRRLAEAAAKYAPVGIDVEIFEGLGEVGHHRTGGNRPTAGSEPPGPLPAPGGT